MILDSSFLIDMIIGREGATKFINSLDDSEIVKTTSMCVYEVYRGIKNKKELALINDMVNDLIVVEFRKEDGICAGKIERELKEKGLMIDPEDCMIAAIALRANEKIITSNKKHFSRIDSVIVEEY